MNESISVNFTIPIDNFNYSDLIEINKTNSTYTDLTISNEGCELLGNFGYTIQGVLGLMCFAVLVCK